MIPVLYTSAEQMANLVRQVYADRIAGSANGQQQRQPSPEDFIRALRGGRGGREGGGGGGAQSEPEKMTLGVDTRSNALVVSAPDPLFEEVKTLVEELDQAGDDSNQSMRVVRVRSSNPATIQQALSSLTGQPVTVNSTSSSDSNQASSSNNNAQQAPNPDDIRRRMEFFNRIRSQMQEGGGGGQTRGGGGGSEARGGGQGGDSGGRGGDRGGRGGRGR